MTPLRRCRLVVLDSGGALEEGHDLVERRAAAIARVPGAHVAVALLLRQRESLALHPALQRRRTRTPPAALDELLVEQDHDRDRARRALRAAEVRVHHVGIRV